MLIWRLLKAVEDGRLSPQRLDEAVLRQLKFMAWLGLLGRDVRVSPVRADELLRHEADNRFLTGIVGAAS